MRLNVITKGAVTMNKEYRDKARALLKQIEDAPTDFKKVLVIQNALLDEANDSHAEGESSVLTKIHDVMKDYNLEYFGIKE
jgi:hypothetical protein